MRDIYIVNGIDDTANVNAQMITYFQKEAIKQAIETKKKNLAVYVKVKQNNTYKFLNRYNNNTYKIEETGRNW